MTYGAWRISYQSSEQAARAAYAECVQLHARLESAEKERDWNAERLEDAIEELKALRAKIEAAERSDAESVAMYRKARDERDALRADLETEQVRLAACGVVALANTPDSAKRARDMRPEYWSASCGDVARLVDENIKLRAKIEVMEQQEPVAWSATDETGTVVEALGMNRSNRFDTALYLAPGAKGE